MAGQACQAPRGSVLNENSPHVLVVRSSSDGPNGADPHEADRLAQPAQHGAVLDHHPPLKRLTCFAVGKHCLRHDHLAAAALVLEARGGVDRRAEVIKHAAGSDRNAGAEMQAELEDDAAIAAAAVEV